MYYPMVLVSVVAALLAARLTVGLVAMISPRWLRRIVFWLVVLPGSFVASVPIFRPVSDDMYFREAPSHVIAIGAPLAALMLSLVGLALFGFRDGGEPKVPRARAWRSSRTALRLLTGVAALILCVFLFDRELRIRLNSLKEEKLATWRNAEAPKVADEDNAALRYIELKQWEDTLAAWRDRTDDIEIDEIDFDDDQLSKLAEECQLAFELLRSASTMSDFYLPRERDYPDPLANDEPLELLREALSLFRLQLMWNAHRGNVVEAFEDVRVLQQIARQIDADVRAAGHFTRGLARGLASDSIERLLQLDAAVPDELLRSLIDENYNPRRGMPKLFAWVEAEYVTKLCDTYLGALNDEAEDDFFRADASELPQLVKQFAYAAGRLSRARDDLSAAGDCSRIYTEFAARYNDPTATEDALLRQLRKRFPHGSICRYDPRDLLFYGTARMHSTQHRTNAMIACELFHRAHGAYPGSIDELVPEFLVKTPVSLEDGEPLKIRPFGEGIVIFDSGDQRWIDSDFEDYGEIRPITAKEYLDNSSFLGEAFKLSRDEPRVRQLEAMSSERGMDLMSEGTSGMSGFDPGPDE